MSVGYACLTIAVPGTDLKSCIMKNASEEKLTELIAHNLNSLERIIDYNIKNDIRLFRISSDIIPFASSPVNRLAWQELFKTRLETIGRKIIENGMRVSMHPGQYTVLNSVKAEVVSRAVKDLEYHAKLLDSLGMDSRNKIILHIGGVYEDKKQAIIRFIDNYNLLDETVKQRIVIENDDKSYHIADVLGISEKLNIPVILDNLHNELYPAGSGENEIYWINECKNTWQAKDGRQKIHYSQKDTQKKSGSHSRSVGINEFLDFFRNLGREDIDIMLEVKDKNISALKCINCLSGDKKIKKLEAEWGRYKYAVLEKSVNDYNEIRRLLQDKNDYPALTFYNIVENALQKESTPGNAVNAAMHVWGYFKDKADDKEKTVFLVKIERYTHGEIPLARIKNMLWNLSVKYDERYLLESYYFVY